MLSLLILALAGISNAQVSNSTATSTSLSTTTSGVSQTTITSTPCLCTAWSQISPAVKACMSITLDNIHAPASSAIILTALHTGASVTFSGNTSFGFTNSSQFRPITITGNNVTIQGAPGSVIDGGGPLYWDGLGNNGGLPKPGQFLKAQLTNHSTIKNLYIHNIPSHGLNLAGMKDSEVYNVVLNNSLGDLPNARSKGLPAGHNTDGFNVGNSNNLFIHDSKVWNQDDCVVVSDSSNVTVSGMYCHGSHGLSIAGGGTGPGHNISNIIFNDSIVTASSNGIRIKTDFNATGSVTNVTFSNIVVSDITNYGIDIQQNYLNSGSGPYASNGVPITHVKFENITGTVIPSAKNYYVLCGDGSCSDWTFKDVNIHGGTKTSSCNYPAEGCPSP